MKGLKALRAQPSNAIDIYPLMIKAAEEKCFTPNPSIRELKDYYFKHMINELAHPMHFWYVARRGRGYVGFLHAVVIPGRWGGMPDSIAIEIAYVDEKYRNRGVGSKLIEELKKDADHIGIKKLRFSCPDSLSEFSKKRGATKECTIMGVEL